MSPQDKEKAVPPVRLAFARKLRELRVLSGFKTARSLAKAVGIDENRYTRYERAEVEPDLDLLCSLAAALGITPNDLLGLSAGPMPTGFGDGAGFGQIALTPGTAKPSDAPSPTERAKAICWSLAVAVADATALARSRPGERSGAKPEKFTRIQDASAIYQRLSRDPFGVIATVITEPAVARAPAEIQARIELLVDELARTLGN